MKDKVKLEFDSYEVRTIINALNRLRNEAKGKNMSTDSVDDLLLKIIDESNKKKVLSKVLRIDNGRRY